MAAQAKINFKNKGALAKSWLIACLSLLILAFKLWLIYRLAFSALPFSSALLIAAVGALSQFIALTPGALGIREGLMAAAAGLIGENIAAMAAVAALDRAVHTIIIFGLGSVSYFSLKRAKNGSPARTKSRPS